MVAAEVSSNKNSTNTCHSVVSVLVSQKQIPMMGKSDFENFKYAIFKNLIKAI